MGQRLFSIGKVPVLLEKLSYGVERRKGQEEKVKVAVLTCTVSPFSAKHANAIDNGVKTEYSIRNVIFDQTGDAQPAAGFDGHSFTLNLKRQDFELFQTPDSEASIVLDHVKIKGSCTVRLHTDNPNAAVLTFKAAVGPLSSKEQSELVKWFTSQRFVTFRESDPSIEFEEVGEGEDDDDAGEEGAEEQPELQADGEGEPATADDAVDAANRSLISHQAGGRKRNRPTTH